MKYSIKDNNYLEIAVNSNGEVVYIKANNNTVQMIIGMIFR